MCGHVKKIGCMVVIHEKPTMSRWHPRTDRLSSPVSKTACVLFLCSHTGIHCILRSSLPKPWERLVLVGIGSKITVTSDIQTGGHAVTHGMTTSCLSLRNICKLGFLLCCQNSLVPMCALCSKNLSEHQLRSIFFQKLYRGLSF